MLLAGAWRGKKPIQRNAILTIAVYSTKWVTPELKKVATTDERPTDLSKNSLYWAIGQILGKKQEILSMQIMIKRMQKFKMK